MNKIIKSNIFFLIILTASVFAVYGKSLSFGFTDLDDDALIYKNINYISDVKNIPKLFLTDCYYSHDFLYYRPVLSLSFALESMILRDNPKIYHATNLILFILSLYFTYLFLSKLNFNDAILKFLILIASVHPIFTSAAVWIPARNDTLLMIFSSLSFVNFINYLRKNKNIYLLLHFLFFTLSLFSKETTVILIPMYVLLVYSFELKITKQQIIKNILMLLPILTVYFIMRNAAVKSIPVIDFILNIKYYLSNMAVSILTYIDKLIFPEYIPVMLYNVQITIITLIINISVMAGLIFLYYFKIINRKIIVFSLIWFVVCLLPTFFLNDYVLLTHRLIVSIAGIIIIISEILNKTTILYTKIKKYLVFAFIILFSGFAYSSYMQQYKYKNAEQYWISAHLDAPNYHEVYHSLATIYAKNGDYLKAEEMITKALSLNPKASYWVTFAGIKLSMDNDLENAEKIYLKISGDLNDKYDLCLFQLGKIYFLKKDFEKAIQYTQKALEIKPHDTLYREYLGNYYALNAQYDKAIDIYSKLIKLDKNNPNYIRIMALLREDLEKQSK